MEKTIEKKRPLKIAIIIVILAAAGYFAFRIIEKVIDAAIDRQEKVWQVETDALAGKIARLEEELRLQREEIVSEEKLTEAFGKEPFLISPDKKIDCEALVRRMEAFCSYLDQKDYIKAYRLENGTAGLFQEIQNKLTEKSPTIVWETRDLITLLRNLAHFYRILGKNNLNLIKDILKNEAEIVEPAMGIFYAWCTHDNCKWGKNNPPSLKMLYEYSGFFLSTIAGRSYLSRRDSKVGSLISYYSLLTLHRANAEALNSYGVDIRPFIGSLINDVGNRKGFLYQRQYLSELEELKKKYQM